MTINSFFSKEHAYSISIQEILICILIVAVIFLIGMAVVLQVKLDIALVEWHYSHIDSSTLWHNSLHNRTIALDSRLDVHIGKSVEDMEVRRTNWNDIWDRLTELESRP